MDDSGAAGCRTLPPRTQRRQPSRPKSGAVHAVLRLPVAPRNGNYKEGLRARRNKARKVKGGGKKQGQWGASLRASRPIREAAECDSARRGALAKCHLYDALSTPRAADRRGLPRTALRHGRGAPTGTDFTAGTACRRLTRSWPCATCAARVFVPRSLAAMRAPLPLRRDEARDASLPVPEPQSRCTPSPSPGSGWRLGQARPHIWKTRRGRLVGLVGKLSTASRRRDSGRGGAGLRDWRIGRGRPPLLRQQAGGAALRYAPGRARPSHFAGAAEGQMKRLGIH